MGHLLPQPKGIGHPHDLPHQLTPLLEVGEAHVLQGETKFELNGAPLDAQESIIALLLRAATLQHHCLNQHLTVPVPPCVTGINYGGTASV